MRGRAAAVILAAHPASRMDDTPLDSLVFLGPGRSSARSYGGVVLLELPFQPYLYPKVVDELLATFIPEVKTDGGRYLEGLQIWKSTYEALRGEYSTLPAETSRLRGVRAQGHPSARSLPKIQQSHVSFAFPPLWTLRR